MKVNVTEHAIIESAYVWAPAATVTEADKKEAKERIERFRRELQEKAKEWAKEGAQLDE